MTGPSAATFLLFFLIQNARDCSSAAAHPNNTTNSIKNNGHLGGNSNRAPCDRIVLDECLASIEPLLDGTSSTKGIPHTEEAVHARCKAFKGGMSCIDDYKGKCLKSKQQQLVEKAVAGARHTMDFLCNDPEFQKEFLRHQNCFRGTAIDWEHCSNHFQGLVAEELQMTNISAADRNLGLCCAKHGFLRCVYYSAQFKCRKDGALFLMKVAQTLTDVQVKEDACRQIKFDEMCTAGSDSASTVRTLHHLSLIFVSLLLFFAPPLIPY